MPRVIRHLGKTAQRAAQCADACGYRAEHVQCRQPDCGWPVTEHYRLWRASASKGNQSGWAFGSRGFLRMVPARILCFVTEDVAAALKAQKDSLRQGANQPAGSGRYSELFQYVNNAQQWPAPCASVSHVLAHTSKPLTYAWCIANKLNYRHLHGNGSSFIQRRLVAHMPLRILASVLLG